MNRKIFSVLFALFAVCSFMIQAQSSNTDKWRYEITPLYVWGSGISGNIGLLGQNVPVDISFSDIVDKFNYGLTLHFEAKKRGLAILADVLYLDLGTEKNGIKVNLKQTVFEGGIVYRLSYLMEILAGCRYLYLKPGITIPVNSIDLERSKYLFDPFFGVRIKYSFPNSDFTVSCRADVGGFGIGTNFSWNIIAKLTYRISEHLTLSAGYRYFDLKYEGNDSQPQFNYDLVMSGPGLGLTLYY